MTSGTDPDFASLAQRAQQAKHDLAAAQAALLNTSVEGFGGGGAVRAVLSGAGEVQDIVIEPGSVDPTRLHDLSTLIIEALQEAQANVKAMHQQKLGSVVNSLRHGLGGEGH